MPNKTSEECPAGCQPGSALFSRITLIIIALISIWLIVSGIIGLIAFKQIPSGDITPLVNAQRIMAWVALIVGILLLLFVAYSILAPTGTLKQYATYLNEPGNRGVLRSSRSD